MYCDQREAKIEKHILRPLHLSSRYLTCSLALFLGEVRAFVTMRPQAMNKPLRILAPAKPTAARVKTTFTRRTAATTPRTS